MEPADDDFDVAEYRERTRLAQQLEVARWQRQQSQDEFWQPAGGWRDDRTASPPGTQTGETEKAAGGVPFVMTDLQVAIMRALDGIAMGIQKLARIVSAGETSRLYRKGGLKELRDRGHVSHKPGVGFYRADSPPTERVAKK